MTITEAARRAEISDTRWSQLENGYRMNRGKPEPEWAPADTLARMARAVGVTPAQLGAAGRGDAAAELAALPAAPELPQDFAELARKYSVLAEQQRSDQDRVAELERKLDRFLSGREGDDKEDENDEDNGSRRAG